MPQRRCHASPAGQTTGITQILAGPRLLAIRDLLTRAREALRFRCRAAPAAAGLHGNAAGHSPAALETRSKFQLPRSWQPFPDTVPALRAAKDAGLRLWIISNTDRAIMEHSLRHLEVEFDGVTVAEDARGYKPSDAPFQHALSRQYLMSWHPMSSALPSTIPARGRLSMPLLVYHRHEPKSYTTSNTGRMADQRRCRNSWCCVGDIIVAYAIDVLHPLAAAPREPLTAVRPVAERPDPVFSERPVLTKRFVTFAAFRDD